jgi:uncharacterized protein YdeI (YjbR/CyaY-like superfamily)
MIFNGSRSTFLILKGFIHKFGRNMQNDKVDSYIENAQLFAQPILIHLRELVHHFCPQVEEKIKWQFPCFEYKGKMLCSIAAFKAHCAFGFWQASLLDDPHGLFEKGKEKKGMGDLGRITDVGQLPSEEYFRPYFMQAIQLIDEGVKNKKPKKLQPEVLETPNFIVAALKEFPKAQTTWDNFSPSCRKEYIDWITEAKREETKLKRIGTMLEWLEEGKSRNWKYQ